MLMYVLTFYILMGLLAGYLIAIASARLPTWRDAETEGRGDAERNSDLLASPRPLVSPWRNATVVGATLALFGLVWQRYGPSAQLIWMSIYASLFVLIAIIDLEHRLVLNRVVLPGAILALVISGLAANPPLTSAALGGAIGFSLFAALAIAWPGAMGGGDVKLAGLIGLMTGFPQVVVALAVSTLAGGVAAAFLLLTRIRGQRSYIPYAPFLVLGGMVGLLYGSEILAWYAGTFAH